jgi:hypothetical protein
VVSGLFYFEAVSKGIVPFSFSRNTEAFPAWEGTVPFLKRPLEE